MSVCRHGSQLAWFCRYAAMYCALRVTQSRVHDATGVLIDVSMLLDRCVLAGVVHDIVMISHCSLGHVMPLMI